MTELFKFIIEIFMSLIDSIKEHSDDIIYGGLIVTLVVGLIKYLFAKIKNGILFLFADVFKTKRQKIESINIGGTTVINKQFLEKIQRIALKQKFRVDDFYLAKQYENCQWYGIIKNCENS
jgi:hypothetical protein